MLDSYLSVLLACGLSFVDLAEGLFLTDAIVVLVVYENIFSWLFGSLIIIVRLVFIILNRNFIATDIRGVIFFSLIFSRFLFSGWGRGATGVNRLIRFFVLIFCCSASFFHILRMIDFSFVNRYNFLHFFLYRFCIIFFCFSTLSFLRIFLWIIFNNILVLLRCLTRNYHNHRIDIHNPVFNWLNFDDHFFFYNIRFFRLRIRCVRISGFSKHRAWMVTFDIQALYVSRI